ncbi:hypothetical protein PtA15_9A529 [Puccinia triticina]|uniref:Uncharacterized protein n=1 Tax=Puccinia triticina TaxID=208348 RepID=A0ABY7CVC9_9BASI|nr:uncharacterized protein PtA15_9A529 [Puccinia triticina]WAQ88402.1 hypothetical protein PtA15_9A529 [Puccinia triticina]
MKSAIAMPLSTILLLFTIPDRNGAKRPDPKIEKPFLNFMPGDYYWVCPWYLSQMLCLHPITSKRSVPHDFRENQGLEHNPLFFCQRGYMGLCCGMPYINPDWKLINRAIGFQLLPKPIDENVIVEFITNVLEDWKLINKCESITTESSILNNRAPGKKKKLPPKKNFS